MTRLREAKDNLISLLEKTEEWDSIEEVMIDEKTDNLTPHKNGKILHVKKKKELTSPKIPNEFLIQIYTTISGSVPEFYKAQNFANEKKIHLVNILDRKGTYPYPFKRNKTEEEIYTQNTPKDKVALAYIQKMNESVRKIRKFPKIQKELLKFGGGRLHFLHTFGGEPIIRVLKTNPVYADYLTFAREQVLENESARIIDRDIKIFKNLMMPYVVEDLNNISIGRIVGLREYPGMNGGEPIANYDSPDNNLEERKAYQSFNNLIQHLKFNRTEALNANFREKLMSRIDSNPFMMDSEVYQRLINLDHTEFRMPKSFFFHPPAIDEYTYRKCTNSKTGETFYRPNQPKTVELFVMYDSDKGEHLRFKLDVTPQKEITFKEHPFPGNLSDNYKNSVWYIKNAKDVAKEALGKEKHKPPMGPQYNK